MRHSRRNFLQQASLALAGTLAAPAITSAKTIEATPGDGQPMPTIGFAGYTFAKFNIDKTIEMMNRLNVTNLSIKDFHLPLNADTETIRQVLGKFGAAGINVYTVGVIYMRSKDDVDKTFDYAKRVGVNMIVGVPNYDLVDYTEQKVKETNIRMAIHNHGPEDKLYPGPDDIMKHIAHRDSRMGMCLDIGHATRAGADPAKAIRQYKNRIFDLHIKDLAANKPDAKVIEVGRGVIDFDALVKALKKTNFNGICSLEYEKDMTDPLVGMAESIGYFRGISRCNI